MPTSLTTSDPPSLGPVTDALDDMPVARTFGLRATEERPGRFVVEQTVDDAFCFVPGTVQAGPLATIADIAAVGACATELPEGWSTSTVDCSIAYVVPARGQRLIARGRRISNGRTLSVGAADVFVVADGEETLCATLLATMRNVPPR